MGRTLWKRFSFVLLILASGLGCRDRDAPEISVRNPVRNPVGNPAGNPTPADPTADQTKNPPLESKTSVIKLSLLERINEDEWAVALLTVQDTTTGSIQIAETLSRPAAQPSFELPYGSYFITLEYFKDAAKTQSLAGTCNSDKTRIHQVKQETYNFIPMICTVRDGSIVSATSDIVIRPIVIR
jgi:hypothetical protein